MANNNGKKFNFPNLRDLHILATIMDRPKLKEGKKK